MAFGAGPLHHIGIRDVTVQVFRPVARMERTQFGQGQAGAQHLGITEYGGLAAQGGQSGGHRIVAEDKGIRDVHVRRGVDKAACHAPVRGGQGAWQVAFGLDAAEALLLDLCGAHVPANRFHGISC